VSGRLSAYRWIMTDEIDFDGTLSPREPAADPPSRAEAEIDWTVIAGVKAHAAYASSTRVRAGRYAGNESPLVARNNGSFQLPRTTACSALTRSPLPPWVTPLQGDVANSLASLAGIHDRRFRAMALARWTVTAR